MDEAVEEGAMSEKGWEEHCEDCGWTFNGLHLVREVVGSAYTPREEARCPFCRALIGTTLLPSTIPPPWHWQPVDAVRRAVLEARK